MIAFISALGGLLLVGFHLKRRYNFSQKQRRGDTEYGEYLQYHGGKFFYFIASALLLGVAVSAEDLTVKNIMNNTMTIVVIFVLIDIFSSRRKNKE